MAAVFRIRSATNSAGAGFWCESLASWNSSEVEAALHSLKYRRLEALQRRVRADIADAERRGDWAQVAVFMAEKVKVDRELRDVDA